MATRIRNHAKGTEIIAAFYDVYVSLHRMVPYRQSQRERNVVVGVHVHLWVALGNGLLQQCRKASHCLGSYDDVDILGPLE
tara:strand:+ start:1169 stop:1411 length:243 start_codon:yes stop_codon:yes gene_type:complete